ncbi:MAG TPA: hypothetical protein VET23_08350 [Chitinophagaceae bacterium]|nr:hypothetical protein [Chitinophagaceae bacterium]
MDELVVVTETAPAEIIKKIDDLNNRAWEVHISEPKSALELSTEAKNLADEYPYQKGLTYAIRNMGVSHRYLSNPETALMHSFQAHDMFIQISEKSGKAQA